jgi:hypothetical protein
MTATPPSVPPAKACCVIGGASAGACLEWLLTFQLSLFPFLLRWRNVSIAFARGANYRFFTRCVVLVLLRPSPHFESFRFVAVFAFRHV